MRRRVDQHQTDGVRRALRWAVRSTLTVSGAAILGVAFGSMASADESLVGGLLDSASEVVEGTTSVIEPASDEPTVEDAEERTQQSTSIVTDVVASVTDGLSADEEPVAETTEVVTEVVEPVAETTEVVTEVVEPVAETTEVVTEVVEPVAETTEVVTEVVEPVAETTEVVTEVVEPVAETTEVVAESAEPTEAADESAGSAAAVTEVAEHVGAVVPEGPTSDHEARPLSRITGLIAPVAAPIVDATRPVTGGLVGPTLEAVNENVIAPVVNDVAMPALAPVLDDVAAPVLNPVVQSVVAPVVQDVVAPIVDPVVTDVADSIVRPVIRQTLAPVVGEPEVSMGLTPVQVVTSMPLAPVEIAVEQIPETIPAIVDVEAGSPPTTTGPSTGPAFFGVQPIAEVVASSAVSDVDGIASAPAAGTDSPGVPGGETVPEPAGLPTSAPSGAASAAGQAGAGCADIVRELELPANAMTTQVAAESLPSVLDVILKVVVAPD